MKKVIVIISAIIAILYATYLIISTREFLITGKWNCMILQRTTNDYIAGILIIIISLLIVLISALVIFNIKPFKLLKVFSAICFALFGLILCTHIFGKIFNLLFIECFGVIIGDNELTVFILNGAPIVAVMVTLLTYIRRALKPTEVEENK